MLHAKAFLCSRRASQVFKANLPSSLERAKQLQMELFQQQQQAAAKRAHSWLIAATQCRIFNIHGQ